MVEASEQGFVRNICIYLSMLLASMAISKYMGHSTALMWVLNLASLALCVAKYCKKASGVAWTLAALYLALGLLSTLFSLNYLTDNMKTLGMHVNLFVVPIYILFISYSTHSVYLRDDEISSVLSFLSMLGCLVLIISVFSGRNDLIGVLKGQIGAYQSRAFGLFNNKNTYGVFLSLTMCADIYLYTQKKNWPRLVLIGAKLLGVLVSFSRAAFLQAIIAVALFLWLERRSSLGGWALVVAAVIGIACAYMTNDAVFSFANKQLLRLETGDAGRAVMRQRAVGLLPESPLALLFGVGYAGVSELGIDIDNTYYYEFFSGGLFRLAFFISMLALPLISNRRLAERGGASLCLASLCTSVHLSYIIYIFFESIAPLELGLINFSFLLFSYVLPAAATESNSSRV